MRKNNRQTTRFSFRKNRTLHLITMSDEKVKAYHKLSWPSHFWIKGFIFLSSCETYHVMVEQCSTSTWLFFGSPFNNCSFSLKKRNITFLLAKYTLVKTNMYVCLYNELRTHTCYSHVLLIVFIYSYRMTCLIYSYIIISCKYVWCRL